MTCNLNIVSYRTWYCHLPKAGNISRQHKLSCKPSITAGFSPLQQIPQLHREQATQIVLHLVPKRKPPHPPNACCRSETSSATYPVQYQPWETLEMEAPRHSLRHSDSVICEGHKGQQMGYLTSTCVTLSIHTRPSTDHLEDQMEAQKHSYWVHCRNRWKPDIWIKVNIHTDNPWHHSTQVDCML